MAQKYIMKSDISKFGHVLWTKNDDALVFKFWQGMNEGLADSIKFVKKFSDKIEKKIKVLCVGYDIETGLNEVWVYYQ